VTNYSIVTFKQQLPVCLLSLPVTLTCK